MNSQNPQDATMFALGKFVKRMNDLESGIQEFVASLIDPANDLNILDQPTVASIVSAEFSYIEKLRVVESLITLRWPERDGDEYRKLIKELESLNERRNQLVHSQWMHSGSEFLRHRQRNKLGKGQQSTYDEETAETIEKDLKRIDSAAFKMGKFQQEWKSMYEESLEKDRIRGW